MSRFGLVVICLLLAAGAVLSACGSSDKKAGPSKEQAALVAFLQKTDRVCRATNSATDPVQPKSLQQIPAKHG